MVNLSPSKRTSARTRAGSQTPASVSSASSTSAPFRVTRLRAKEAVVPPAPALTRVTTNSGSGFLAKGKEGFRKVSDKIKEKEKEAAAKAKAVVHPPVDNYGESLQAFLRIRPPPAEAENAPVQPYLELQDSRNVLMTAPPEGARAHIPKPPHVYSFDRVFAPDSTQSDFFTTTTLPLVEKLLRGDNGLIFAYGVSNSGKSYTIQGGNNAALEERGVLPRAIDVVFNSISGLESNANLKCQGLADVVLTDDPESPLSGLPTEPEAHINDTVKVDRNFSYAIFVSYSEVYNEKIFDLLDSVLPAARPASNIPRTMSMGVGLSSGFGTSMSMATMANGGAGILKRRALVLKNDPEGSGKYISGLNEIRVRTREEALAVFRSGQRARQVFGTMANRESSRSHGIFTVKVVRIHNGAPEDPDSAQVSRLAIVDLAGSERTRNTATTGDRLKEAGNINKSLMVLGQCIEVLRANQQKMTSPPSLGHRRRLAVVPFRHSKLTEIFQNFFVGDGRAVMIVHVNPYDTGFDENSHVMRFSSIAREIHTASAPKTTSTLKRQISSHFSSFKNAVSGQRIKVMVPVMPKTSVTPVNVNVTAASSFSRPTASSANRGSLVAKPPTRPPTPQGVQPEAELQSEITVVEEEIEVVEEEPEEEEDDEHDYLVDYLFEQLKDLKTQLYESEMRSAALEMEIRDEVSRDMQKTIQRLHADFNHRLQMQTALGEEKADMKLDILQRTIASEEDTSFEDSFMSADGSMSSDTVDGDTSIMSDPFGPNIPVRPSAPEPAGDTSFAESDSSSLDVLNVLDISANESIDEDVDEGISIDTGARFVDNEAEEASEDDEEEGSEEEEEEDEGSEEGSEVDGDEISESEPESSFAESSFNDTASIVSTPPRPRRTLSPTKKISLAKTPKMTPAKATKALRESTRQPVINLMSDEEDMVVAKDTPAKKKRTLGKRVVMDDEMEANAGPVGGAEVRRMVR